MAPVTAVQNRAADSLREEFLELVKRAQPLLHAHQGIRGGIPGSDPIWGDYLTMALPNWAAKYFIDALLRKEALAQ